jgi:hypothetical protein
MNQIKKARIRPRGRVVLGALAMVVCGGLSARAQTWNIDASLSSVFLEGQVDAAIFDTPDLDNDTQTEAAFQTPFVDLLGDPYDIGQNMSASATAFGPCLGCELHADAGGFVKANQGSSLSIHWRAAVSLELTGDVSYLGNGESELSSALVAQLSGLTPGLLYRVRYEWDFFASAIEKHEGSLEDPERASTTLDFTFGSTFVPAFIGDAGPSAGFPTIDSGADSGVFFLLGSATPVDLTVNLSAMTNATIDVPPINGSPPEDSARPEAFGNLRFTVEVIPEPSGMALALLGLLAGFQYRRR